MPTHSPKRATPMRKQQPRTQAEADPPLSTPAFTVSRESDLPRNLPVAFPVGHLAQEIRVVWCGLHFAVHVKGARPDGVFSGHR